ncbi:hypothetical protein TrRE_jg8831, partial [Triparma retinervis]
VPSLLEPLNTLFVGRLSYDVTSKDLLRMFGSVGQVKDVKVVVRHGSKTAPRRKAREGRSEGSSCG